MPKTKGPLPRFADFHIQMALDQITKYERIGRKQIAKKLGIGEGSVRTILNQLKEQGLITSSRGGHRLTNKGKLLLKRPAEFIQVDVGDLTVGEINVATIARGAASKVVRGIEQRDEAVKAGANGATVLVFRGGKLRFPDDFTKVSEKKVGELIKKFKPQNGDVIIISTGKDVIRAEAGARAAVRTLTKKA